MESRSKRKRGPKLTPAEEVRRWNLVYPIGTPVTVEKDSGEIFKTVTRSEAWALGGARGGELPGHTAVVMVDGIAGGYLLSRVRPIPPEARASSESLR
jgi:hypothetical protein